MSKKSIELAEPWTFRTPIITRHYPAGKHSVDEDVHAKAVEDGVVKEKADGNGRTGTGKKEGAEPAEGEQ